MTYLVEVFQNGCKCLAWWAPMGRKVNHDNWLSSQSRIRRVGRAVLLDEGLPLKDLHDAVNVVGSVV